MKNKFIAAILGTAVVLAAAGCSSDKKTNEDQPETLGIYDIEVMSEEVSESVGLGDESAEEETLQIDLSDEGQNSSSETEDQTQAESEALDETEDQTRAESETSDEIEDQTDALAEEETDQEAAGLKLHNTNEDQETLSKVEDQSNDIMKLRLCCDQVNVREGASTDSGILASLSVGARVLAVAEEDEWTKVCYEGEDSSYAFGYIKTEFLVDGEKAYCAIDDVNIRAEKSTDSDIMDSLSPGDRVILEEQEEDGWSRITYQAQDRARTFFAKNEFLEKEDNQSYEKQLRSAAEDLTGSSSVSDVSENEQQDTNQTEEKQTEIPETELSEATEAQTELPETETETEHSETALNPQTETDSESEPDSGIQSDLPEDSAPQSQENIMVGKEGVIQNSEEEEQPHEFDSIEEQFDWAKTHAWNLNKAGILYPADDTEIQEKIEEYKGTAEFYGMEIVAVPVEDELDCDIQASELVGMVDCILTVDPGIMEGFMETITMYADAAGIPVF